MIQWSRARAICLEAGRVLQCPRSGYFEMSFDTVAMPSTFAFRLVTPVRSSSSSSEGAEYSIWIRALTSAALHRRNGGAIILICYRRRRVQECRSRLC